MNIWVDAQLPPTLATWISDSFDVDATALRDMGLRDAQDVEIFEAARVRQCGNYDKRQRLRGFSLSVRNAA